MIFIFKPMENIPSRKIQTSNSQAEIASANNYTWRDFVRENILEGETFGAKVFDFFLVLIILASIAAAVIDSINLTGVSKSLLFNFEIFFTVVFTLEYLLRATCAKKPSSFMLSWSGLIDLISLMPLYLSFIVRSSSLLNLIRMLRLLRIFSRLFKIGRKIDSKSFFYQGMLRHLGTGEKILFYFKDSRRKFLFGYFFTYLFLIASLSEVLFGFISKSAGISNNVFLVVGYVLLAISLIMLVRYELKILSVRYAITSHRVLRSKGIIHEDFKSTTFAYIADVYLYQSLWERIIFIGEIKIKTTGNDYENIELNAIANPMKIKKVIHDNIMKVHEMRNRGHYSSPVNLA
jgi:membrane protein YdbS with pleckstrin-like domain